MAINTSNNKVRIISTTVGLANSSKYTEINSPALVVNTSDGGIFYADGTGSNPFKLLAALPNHSHSGYLPTSGGMIYGNGADLLGVNRIDGYPVIVFYHNNTTMGRLGFNTTGEAVAQIGGDYKTILHSGNIGDYTAGKSNQLATARTIWGQSFDGTANIDSGININSYFTSGTVEKLSDLGERGLVVGIGDSRDNWGMGFWIEGNGKGYIQQQAFTSTATIYSLCLQPFGGNVGIGTNDPSERLHVNGNVKATKFIGTLQGNADTATTATTATSASSATRAARFLTDPDNIVNQDDAYNPATGLHCYRVKADVSNNNNDGFILQWSWMAGSVGGQIYIDDNPSNTMMIRGRETSSGAFTKWNKFLHSGNYTSYCSSLGHTHNYIPTSEKVNAAAVAHTGYGTNGTYVPTMNFLSYWNGAYNSGNASNLTYCKHGAFGTIVTKSTSDYLSKSGGTMDSTAYIAWNNGADGNDISDWNTITGNGLRIISSTTTTSNAPHQYSTALHVKGRYGFQIAGEGGEASSFYIRNIDSRSNSWKKLIHSGNYTDYCASVGHSHNGYLSTSGGTLTSAGVTTLNLKDTTRNESAISYYGNSGIQWFVGKGVGSIGEKFGFYNGTAGVVVNIDVSGNITAPKFIGNLAGNADTASTATSAGHVKVTACNSTTNSKLWDDITVDTLRTKFWDVYNDGGPSTYGNILEINGIQDHWKPQLWFEGRGDNNGRIFYRNRGYNSTSWSDWKTIAFTSDIPTSLPANGGNATSADKAICVVDYGNTNSNIYIGYGGESLAAKDCSYLAGYAAGGTKIKDITAAEVKKWLSLGSAAYTASGDYATSSHGHSGYLSTSGGDMSSGARISASGGDLNLGNASNAAWVNIQDMRSAAGSSGWYVYTDGKAYFAKDVSANNFITASDKRLKKNITEITNTSKSLDLTFYEFDYKNTEGHSAGHIAQEVREVYPEFVRGNETEDEHLSIDYTALQAVQIKALIDEINKLKEEIRSLKSSNIKFK